MIESLSLPESKDRLSIYTTSQLFSAASYSSLPVLNCVKQILERQKVYQDGDRQVSPDEVRELLKLEASVLEKKKEEEEEHTKYKNCINKRPILYVVAVFIIAFSFIYTYFGFGGKESIKFLHLGTQLVLLANFLYSHFVICSFNRKKKEEKEDVKEPITTMKSSELIQRQLQLVDIMSEVVEPLKRKNKSLDLYAGLLSVVYGFLNVLFGCFFSLCLSNNC